MVNPEDLEAARRRLHEHEHLAGTRAALSEQIAAVAAVLGTARVESVDELQDAQRLSEVSLASIMARISGSYDDRLAREQAEADAARLRVQAHEQRLRELRDEQSRLGYEISLLADARDRYESLMAEAERDLDPGDPRTPEFRKILAELEQVGYQMEWVRHARATGREAVTAVDCLLHRLDDAAMWSVIDMGSGGWADVGEHQALTEARRLAFEAQRAIDLFLRVVREKSGAVHVPVVGNDWVLDVFFDNIIVDFARHREIGQAKKGVLAARTWIAERTEQLDVTAADQRERMEELHRRRSALHQG